MTDDKHTMGGFIPGFLTLLRFQAHHRHILGRALPKLKGHVSRCLWGFTHPRGPCSASSTRAPPDAAPGRLQEFLQDVLSQAGALEDGTVCMQLQASVAELPRMNPFLGHPQGHTTGLTP
ncbi:USP6 N-terminal-like protein isoform X4 [Ovis canadensis]|uniref:USP6 N-terminal-like protein isoform X4 n=1 Tax=Ovis canadensis TaxID=37174 RepID=UPI003750B585